MLLIVALLPFIAVGQRERGRLLQEAHGPLCIEGKLVPELYVLGAQKAATSTLAKKLRLSGVDTACNGHKECHFFDTEARAWGELFREKWLRQMPTCPAKGSGTLRSMVGDYTPSYLRLVPMPPGARRGGRVHDMVARLSSLYGAQAHRLRFIVTLREPLARMYSAFIGSPFYCRQCHRPMLFEEESQENRKGKKFLGKKSRHRAPNFQDAMFRALGKARASRPVIEDWLWASLYGRQLGYWLNHFDAGQFYIIPFKHMINRSKTVCWEMRRWLNFSLQCDVFGRNFHANPGRASTRPLEKAISPNVRQAFNAYMKAEEETLMQLLNSTKSLQLGLYRGGSVKEWLESGW